MTYDEVLKTVFSLKGRGMRFGTERTRELLNGLDCPDNKLKIIHISGTNGKGSIAEYLTQILVCAGKKVGTFTSPAVYDYREQFKIDGKFAKKDDLKEALSTTLQIADGATQFEVETASALYLFAKKKCEYAVVECGLGGTYDATNAIFTKEIAVVSSISLEHTAVLGNTLQDVCKHKAGIIKNCPAVVNPLQSEEVLQYFRKIGAIIPQMPEITGINFFSYGGKEYKLTMKGSCQPYNATCAIEVAKQLKIDETAIYLGVYRSNLRGRIEVLSAKDGKSYVLDGAHNPASFIPLKNYLMDVKGKKTVIFGCLSDKDVAGDLTALKDCADEVIAVKSESDRAMDLDKIYLACRSVFGQAERADGVESALNMAENNTVVVCGSFTILAEAYRWIEKRL